jgi:hypothetical protein
MNYSHYCSTCRTYAECTHSDPEKAYAHCPKCNNRMRLNFSSLSKIKIELGLAKREIMLGTVTYTKL